MRKKVWRVIALVLAISTVLSAPAYAQTRASNFISSYGGYLYSTGSTIQVYVNVVGTDVSDNIGSTTIVLKESTDQSTWSTVKTFSYTNYSVMMGHNTYIYDFHVDYTNAVSGRYYYARVTIWVGRSGNGDSRTFNTPVIQV